MTNVVTVEVWNPSYTHSKISLDELSNVYKSIPSDASIGLTLNDGEDDCVIVTVEAEFSTVTALRDRTFYNLQLDDDPAETIITINGGEEVAWPKGCLLPREMGVETLLEARDRKAFWALHTWIEQ